jgi:hypothetical protein
MVYQFLSSCFVIRLCLKVQMNKNESKSLSTCQLFAILITYLYRVPLKWHVDDGKLCLLINTDIEKF